MNELQNRLNYINYTIQHRKVFRALEKELFGKVSLRGWLHDLDKIPLYLILGKRITSALHKKYSKHHYNKASTKEDYEQMIIDWECARFTKKDKPLNAYDTLHKYYIDLVPEILPILQKLNLDYSNLTNSESET